MDLIGYAYGGTAPYTFSWDVTFDGDPDIIGQNPLNIGFSSSGYLPVGMTVTDAAGCSATIVQDVYIPEDIESPILDCPSGDHIFLTDPGVCFSEQSLVEVLDNCDPFPIVICELTGATIGTFTGSAPIQFQKGITFVSCTATDNVGNISECAFSITVLDEELPTIICPPSQQLTIPFCDEITTAFYAPPTGADNCPMVAFSASHPSGSEFSCGATTVIYTATDMSGNTSVCNFEINVTCTCASMGTASIECGPGPDTYTFTMVVNNASGSGFPCDLLTTLPVDQGTLIGAPTITWDAGNTVATITGIIQAVLPIPSQFDLTVLANCSCPSGLSTVCSLSVSLSPGCCRGVSLSNLEICRESPSHPVSLDFFGSVANLVQVEWYMAAGPCPANTTDPGWLLYATTFAATTDVFPPYLAGDFCMYAVVTVGDFPCQTLTTNIAYITLCEPVACTLPDQEFCYTGSAITPLPIDILVEETTCPYTIDWLDAAGNPIPALHGQTSFQPPPILWSGLPGDCKQDFTFSAQVTGPCGPRTCTATISLYDDAAPAGVLDMVPFESQAFCPGEDATLLFVPGCPKPPSEVVWEWFSRTENSTFAPVPGAGMTNTLIHTNRLWEDTWFAVDITNGVCSTDRVEYFIDVLDVLTLTSFTAGYNDICNPTGVTMAVNIAPCNTSGSPCNCGYTIAWYRDWDLLHTDVNTSGPLATYTHIPASIDLIAGNYYAVITENCCGQQVKSDVIEIGPPSELVIAGPCFNCNYETQTVEAILTNPEAGVTCSYNWATAAPGNILSGQSTSQIEVNAGGLYWVTVTCSNGCTKTGHFNLKQCGGAVEASISGNTVICPGATTLLTASGGGDYLWSTGSIDEIISVQDAGTYTVTVTGSNGATATAEVTVILSPGTSIEWHNVPALEVFVSCAADVPPPDLVTASDDLGGDVPVVFDEQVIPGNCLNQFVVVRTWTATVVSDVCGTVVSEIVQIIDVNDTKAPVLYPKPADIYLDCPDFVPPPEMVTAYDNCGTVDVTFSENSIPTFCTNQIIVREWVATDACGNTDGWTQHIFVEDLVPPTLFGLPADMTLTLTDTDPLPPVPTVTAEDNCGDLPMVTFSETDLVATCTTPRLVLRTWSAEDLCGNLAVFTQEIQIGISAAVLASISGNTTICPGGGTLLTASGGGDYMWSTTETNASLTVHTAGIYTVTVTNAAGCTSTAQVTVGEAPINQFSVSGGGTICPGDVSCIYLSGSDMDVLYTVYRNGTSVVQQQGTGASMSICHPFISGTYTIWGARSGTTPLCSLRMTGNAVFTYFSFPKGGNLSGPNSYCAGGLGVFLSINNTSTDVEYALFLDGNPNPLEVVQGMAGTSSWAFWSGYLLCGCH
ncbi:MAG: HYR domain-containing protein [Lewinellaceae bacterium]|nr:HYR domain-containing protein [Lewinellaceae bacterium]